MPTLRELCIRERVGAIVDIILRTPLNARHGGFHPVIIM